MFITDDSKKKLAIILFCILFKFVIFNLSSWGSVCVEQDSLYIYTSCCEIIFVECAGDLRVQFMTFIQDENKSRYCL